MFLKFENKPGLNKVKFLMVNFRKLETLMLLLISTGKRMLKENLSKRNFTINKISLQQINLWIFVTTIRNFLLVSKESWRSRCRYKLDTWVSKAVKLISLDCPNYCPFCNSGTQIIEHWLIKMSNFSSYSSSSFRNIKENSIFLCS